MKITKASDYAIRALIYMTKKPAGTIFMRSELSKLSNAPDSFLGKILQNMAKSNILASERGKNGGFRLNKTLEEISMLDVITAVEGALYITDCIENNRYCGNTATCKVHKKWQELQNVITDSLKNTTLKDIASE